jgi:hypothetical protein
MFLKGKRNMPKKTLSYQEKFRSAIDKIVAGQYSESVGKAQLTKIVEAWQDTCNPAAIKMAIEDILRSLNIPSTSWIYKIYVCVPGYYWLDSSYHKYGDTVLGWYSEYQVKAEALPLKLYRNNPVFDDGDAPMFEVLDWGATWEGRGFYPAQKLPYYWGKLQKFDYGDNPRYWLKKGYLLDDDIPLLGVDLKVSVPVEEFSVFATLGYASPCQIQWSREFGNHLGISGLYVKRSIIPHGFWCAWKWWEGAALWYFDHRPELFEDCEIWGLGHHVHYAPPEPYAAVLGGSEEYRARVKRFGLVVDEE